ncbi:MAG: DNA-processing protein DprA [Acidimicrobiales bacterium]
MSSAGEHAAALASLPGAGSARLGRLLESSSASAAWAKVQSGRVPVEIAPAAVRAEWRAAAVAVDLASVRASLQSAGVMATTWHDGEHPAQFTRDIDPAPIAFRRGALPDPALPHVAIVGTRRASAIGREIARDLGFGLATAGVVVVSGLALGIDGAAHRGALAAAGVAPVAVVGSGCDVPYPPANRELWAEVGHSGALLSEAPMGARPEPWRFPARNRLIVAMADLVVVVESRSAGGSLLTVDQAIRRGVDVMAVPGSLRNGAAAGTNRLLSDGCAPVLDVDDVTDALGLDRCGASIRRSGTRTAPSLSDAAATVLGAVDDGPTSIDQLASRAGVGAGEIFAVLAELELAGLIMHDGARVRRS